MVPTELSAYLAAMVNRKIKAAAMIWGPPGIGKSSIVHQIAKDQKMTVIDLRLSQLAPTDLRGLPVPKDGVAYWAVPEFLPNDGQGILFLDEINMAPPAMQGVAQQLILDRKVGNYAVPAGWFVWAAGNRREDRASVFEMPAPLANRFIHLDMEPDIDDFRRHGLAREFHEDIVSFVAFRQDLLHKIFPDEAAWPSPRSWEIASNLHNAGLNIEPAVGISAGSEFYAYLDIIANIPNLDAIVSGRNEPKFPSEVSLSYATVVGLVSRVDTSKKAVNALNWLVEGAPAEWVQMFAADLFPKLRARDLFEEAHTAIMAEPKLRKFLTEFAKLLAG